MLAKVLLLAAFVAALCFSSVDAQYNIVPLGTIRVPYAAFPSFQRLSAGSNKLSLVVTSFDPVPYV